MARREQDLAGRDLVALADDPRDLRAHLFHRDVERLENAGGQASSSRRRPREDVLGADVVVLDLASSCARTTTCRARSVNRSNNSLDAPFGSFPGAALPPARED